MTFGSIDGDRNGVINSTEAIISMNRGNPGAGRVSPAFILEKFQEMDGNGDGVIQPKEFDASL
jgi:hypothetical protein